MNDKGLTTEEKKNLLKAINIGLLSKAEVRKPDFNFKLYTLKDLPIFAFKSLANDFIEFMGVSMPEEDFIQLMAFYKELGDSQEVILIKHE